MGPKFLPFSSEMNYKTDVQDERVFFFRSTKIRVFFLTETKIRVKKGLIGIKYLGSKGEDIGPKGEDNNQME